MCERDHSTLTGGTSADYVGGDLYLNILYFKYLKHYCLLCSDKEKKESQYSHDNYCSFPSSGFFQQKKYTLKH